MAKVRWWWWRTARQGLCVQRTTLSTTILDLVPAQSSLHTEPVSSITTEEIPVHSSRRRCSFRVDHSTNWWIKLTFQKNPFRRALYEQKGTDCQLFWIIGDNKAQTWQQILLNQSCAFILVELNRCLRYIPLPPTLPGSWSAIFFFVG